MGLPVDFLIIGAQRCGTTSMRAYLAAHPDVTAPRREIDFFTDHYDRGLQWYDGQFKPGKLRGEKSPNYLADSIAPKRIAKLEHNVKFIVLLRDPVERVFSHWRLMIRLRLESRPFEEAIHGDTGRKNDWYPYLKRGHYAEQLAHWFSVFSTERFFIIRSRDFYEDADAVYNTVLEFLGLKPHHLRTYVKRGKVHRPIQRMSQEVRKWLDDYYRPHNRRLNELLGCQFWTDSHL